MDIHVVATVLFFITVGAGLGSIVLLYLSMKSLRDKFVDERHSRW